MTNLQEKIKFLRHAKGWSQEEIASKLCISTNGYGCIERGETDINITRLKQLADVFEINLIDLISGEIKTIYNQTGDNNTNYQDCHNVSELKYIKLKHELEKKELLLTERNKEVDYLKNEVTRLKEVVSFLKK